MSPLYRIADLRHSYGTRTVLSIPALTIAPDEIFAIVGPSGAGKSTLLRLLALLEAPYRGTVHLHLNGQSLSYTNASVADRRQIGMVFQKPLLLSRSVRDNVAYGLRLRGERNSRHQVEQILERVALRDLADAHPRTLSGGEAQRVAVARALVLNPRVLLLDEPTANLDPFSGRLIEDLVREQHTQHGTTVMLVTHNLFQARRLATTVGLMIQGELIETAPTEQFFTAPQDPRSATFASGELIY
ncbi:MAG: phosphate ABC transporter ATP-binding protein [Anaerolineae bacterium]|nr:phosphate ABC transporter ATP-binding protein [Anaerolineae bacterium]